MHSVEFKLLKCKYVKELQYKIGIDVLQHDQLDTLLCLNGSKEVSDALGTERKRLASKLTNIIDAVTFGSDEDAVAQAPQMTDNDKIEWLEALTAEKPAFANLQEIAERMQFIES